MRYGMNAVCFGGRCSCQGKCRGLDRRHWQSYKAQDGKALFDEEQNTALAEESEKEALRQRRQTECFTFVNRGQLWYAALSIKQLAELTAWYTAWLKVTETKTIPERPEWLE